MNTTRLEAFSDGVIAILITIMVLELKVPHGSGWPDLAPVLPVLLTYVLSFAIIGIYWNNHHHMFHAVGTVSGAMLWANLHLLFWLSLIPFVTAWMGEHHDAAVPAACYAVVMVMCAAAFALLQRTVIVQEGAASTLAAAVGARRKERASLLMYVSAVPLAFVNPWLSDALYVGVALMWLVPDRRIEAALRDGARH